MFKPDLKNPDTPFSVPFAHRDAPFRLADFSSLVEALDYAAESGTGVSFYNARGVRESGLSYAEVRDKSIVIAKAFKALGLERHDRVGIVASLSPDFICPFFACQYAGVLAVPLPALTGLGGREGYEQQLSRIIGHAEVKLVIAPEYLIETMQKASAGVGTKVMTVEQLLEYSDEGKSLDPFSAGDLSHIQFSSGSTRNPSGILITQDALMANARAIAHDGLKLVEEERLASWLPFYHDMGLIGCLVVPTSCQITVDYLQTEDFARRPLQWLELISRNRCTAGFSPTFGYEICTQRFNNTHQQELSLDLSSWRIAGIGGEMVQPDKLFKFAETFALFGFNSGALTPCYGLAEATLAISFSPQGRGITVDTVNKDALISDKKALPYEGKRSDSVARSFTNCGRALDGHTIEIRDEEGNVLPERSLGCVFAKGPSHMAGYYKDEEATEAALTGDGWLNTGDMGYIADGMLYVTGRAKDLIIINGRNIWPQDLEWYAEQVDGLKSRNSAAFMVEREDGGEQAVILVQFGAKEEGAREELRKAVRTNILRNTGVECEVVLIPRRSLPFTTSGKLSRTKAKAMYLNNQYVAKAA